MKKKQLVLILSFFVFSFSAFAQLTTSEIKGKVSSETESLPGATVILIHEATGSEYTTITNTNGMYNLPNLNPGGPYTLKVSYVGYKDYSNSDIFLSLGQVFQLNIQLSENTVGLGEIQVVAYQAGVFDGNTTGSKTTLSKGRIENLPTIGRGISDFARITPQAKVNKDGGLEIAGQNSRYNSFTIDGAVQNDVFGLASNGTNGGQIGLNPMSMDIIDQLTISLSPYDVSQSGFSGAGINAVTKSGTNRFEGTVYNYFRNQSFAGKTPTDDEAVERKKLNDFTSNTFGLSVGGPLIKNKLFFYANAEVQRDKTPKPFDFSQYTGTARKTAIDSLSNMLSSDYNYDAGTYESTEASLDAEKFFLKLDWNINAKHKFSIRHQYSKGRSISPSVSSPTTIYFSNSGIDFSSKTNSTTAELKSVFGNRFANKLRFVATIVDDDRDPMGANFPYITIRNEKINLGSEQFSTANRLKQSVFSLTDNFNIYAGNHNITLGMHHEYYDMFNVFIRQNFGVYTYTALNDFLVGNPAVRYDRSFSNVDNVTGDESKGAAEFSALQLGFYAQDNYQATDKLNLTFGIRVDIAMYLDTPAENTDFNDNVIPYLESEYNVDFMGAKTGQMPNTSPLFSPRVGFNWDVNGDKTMQLRGGAGLFTSRIPYVWPGGSYNNNGMTVGGMTVQTAGSPELVFNSDWENQPSVTGNPSGQIDIFAKDFKMPQVFRANFAVDKKLPYDINATLDFTYTKNVNNVTYQNLYVQDTGRVLSGTGDTRTLWSNIVGNVNTNSGTSGRYTGVYLGSNTSEGHSFNFMAQLDKSWKSGIFASFAYNYGVAKSINDGQSSQNSSQWRVPNNNGRNNLDLGYSVYDLGHRVVANVSYKIDYSDFANTTISLFYNGQSGERFSYGYDNGVSASAGPAGDNTDGYDLTLLYVPVDVNDINLVDVLNTDGTVAYSAAQQWTDLDAFISDNKYLNDHRGETVERHAQRMPFENIFDLKIIQEFKFKVAPERENRFQISLDVFNLGNMINKDWGRMHYGLGDYNTYRLLEFKGYETGTNNPTYTYVNKAGKDTWGIDDSGLQSSRWQAQISVRYIF
ncbi:MAG: TonB-dependent receptor [Salinivirgaceae bacterium]